MRRARRGRRTVRAAFLAALAASFALAVAAARAAHDAGESCYNCHTLDEVESDPGTSLINKLSRTFPRIKAGAGRTAPATLGCTYCHNDNGHADRMKPALPDFTGRTSFHPVGFDFRGAGKDTNNEFLSAYGASREHELDCVDCHDLAAFGDGRDDPATPADEGSDGDPATSRGGASDKYPEHGPPAYPWNPAMLRSVAAAGEYDALCRSCHDSERAVTVKGVEMRLESHADGSPGRPLRESDGTVLRTGDLDGDGAADAAGVAMTGQCTACHDTHYSTNRRLFNDGHERHKDGSGKMVQDSPITSGDCTGLCHYAGDWHDGADGGSFFRRGHGMPESTYRYRGGRPDASGEPVTMGFACTACHLGIDPAQKPHADRKPSGASERERYLRRYSLSGTLQATDTGSVMGNPAVGICHSCHQGYEAHATAARGKVGCLDCHDEHAEGVGTSGNVMMIPERAKKPGSYRQPAPAFAAKAGVEPIIYDSTRLDPSSRRYEARWGAELDFFRRDDADGICDSTECHGLKSPVPYAPLEGWVVADSTTHTGGPQEPGADCGACHKHNRDAAGGWRARSTCEDCHAARGRGHLDPGESQATHDAHVASGYVEDCDDCHAHDGRSVPPETGDHGVGGKVDFGGARMGAEFEYEESFDTEGGCNTAANGCHDSAGGEGRWQAGALSGCADCHAAAGKLLARAPTSGLHAVRAITRHDGALQDGGCVNCHDAATPSGAHLNGSLESAAMVPYQLHANVLSYASAAGCQAAAACHGGGDGGTWRRRWAGVVDAVPGGTGGDAPGDPVCGNCHGDFTGWRWDESTVSTTDHSDPFAGNAGDRMDEHSGCRTCHGWGAAGYDRTWRRGNHGNGSVEMNGPDAGHGAAAGAEYNDDTGGCAAACHASEFTLRSDSGWPPAYGDYGTGD